MTETSKEQVTVSVSVDRLVSPEVAVGQQLVRIDSEVMQRCGLSPNDVAQVSVPDGAVLLVRVLEPDPGDVGTGVIRCDRYLRQGLRARLGSSVRLSKVEPQVVRQVYLQPPLDFLGGHHLADHLLEHLIEDAFVLSPGAFVYLPVSHEGNGAAALFQVSKTEDGPGIAGPGTRLSLLEGEQHDADVLLDVSLDDVGGLEKEVRAVLDLVELPLGWPAVYRQLGIQAPRGIILHGPPGTGKTHASRALAHELNVRFFYVNGPEIVGSLHGETEGTLRKLFGEAAHHAPAIICVDEIDAITRARRDLGSQTDVRAVTQLLSLMDGLRKVDGVIVIGTTNQIDRIDPAFRRAGRFDREIYFGPPDAAGRIKILRIHTRDMPLESDVPASLETLAKNTHGFVGADLVELCREAGLISLRRVAPAVGMTRRLGRDIVMSARVSVRDFDEARLSMRPSAARHTLVAAKPSAPALAGLTAQRTLLRRLADQRLFGGKQDDGIDGGILLHGPAGTGKSALVEELAAELEASFITVNGPEIFSKWLGDTEEAIRNLFDMARRMTPAVIVFDQLEAVAPVRGSDGGAGTADRVVGQLLVQLDQLSTRDRILVVGLTNRADLIDSSVLRAGRIGLHIELALPDETERAELIDFFGRDSQLRMDAGARTALLSATVGASRADLRMLCQVFRMQARDGAASLELHESDIRGAIALSPLADPRDVMR